MIPIKKEPKELYKQFKKYERCLFCRNETDTWHIESNTPICSDCSKIKSVSDVEKAILKEPKDLKNWINH